MTKQDEDLISKHSEREVIDGGNFAEFFDNIPQFEGIYAILVWHILIETLLNQLLLLLCKEWICINYRVNASMRLFDSTCKLWISEELLFELFAFLLNVFVEFLKVFLVHGLSWDAHLIFFGLVFIRDSGWLS